MNTLRILTPKTAVPAKYQDLVKKALASKRGLNLRPGSRALLVPTALSGNCGTSTLLFLPQEQAIH
jgi:hypothetical protein